MIQAACIIQAGTPRSLEAKKKCCNTREWSRIDDQFVRINQCLNNILSNLDSLSKILEELEDDPIKAAKKQVEFSTRFTRNYLCELRQKMTEIRKILEKSENNPNRGHQNLFNCFMSCFQTGYQAFQNIEKNLRYIIFNKIPCQIDEFINYFGDLCFIANAAYWDGAGNKLIELGELNTALFNKLKDNEANIRKEELQKKEKQQSLLKIKTDIKKVLPAVGKRNKKSNFSMYKSNQNTAFEKLWKKKTKALAQAKFGNKQEFQLIPEQITESRNPISKQSAPEVEIKEKEKPKRKIMKPVPENEMETMVQSIAPNYMTSDSEPEEVTPDKPVKTCEKPKEAPVVVKNEMAIYEGIKQNEIIQEKFEMGPVLDAAFKTMFNHIMSQVMINIDPEKKETENDEENRSSIVEQVKKSNFREDNVKLICIVEDEASCFHIQD